MQINQGSLAKDDGGAAVAIPPVTGIGGITAAGNVVSPNFSALPTQSTVTAGATILVSSPANPTGAQVPASSITGFIANADTGTADPVNLGDNFSIIGKVGSLIKTKVGVTPNTVEVGLDTTGATLGQNPTLDASGNIVWSTPTQLQADNGISIGTDGKIELGGVLHQATTINTANNPLNILNLPTSSAPTLENLAIDTVTGQVVRDNSIYEYTVLPTQPTFPVNISTAFTVLGGVQVAFTKFRVVCCVSN